MAIRHCREGRDRVGSPAGQGPERVGLVEHQGRDRGRCGLRVAGRAAERLFGRGEGRLRPLRVEFHERQPMGRIEGQRTAGGGRGGEPRSGLVGLARLGEPAAGHQGGPGGAGVGLAAGQPGERLGGAGPVFLRPAGVGQPLERVGGPRPAAGCERAHDPLGVGGTVERGRDVGPPEGHVVGEPVAGLLLGEPLEHRPGLGELFLFGQAHAQGIKHVGRERRPGMVSQKRLPAGDGLVAAAGLPERLTGQVRGLGRLGMRRRGLHEVLQGRGGGSERLPVGLAVRGPKQAAAELESREGHGVGGGLAREHLAERPLGGGPVILLELADREVIAALQGQRVGGMGLNQRRPFLRGEVPGLAILERGGRRVG